MSLKIFILGRPGSGKSSVAQLIQELVSKQGWSVQHIYDYPLLQALFLREIADNIPDEQRKFRPRGPEAFLGFDVIDYKVLDTVIYQMADKLKALEQTSSGQKHLLLIEFARGSYESALRIFGNECLQDAYLLYVNLAFEICIERLNQRIGDGSKFSHFVSEDIMRRYYFRDDWLDGSFGQYLKALQKQNVQTYYVIIGNRGSKDQLKKKVESIVERYLLRETEPLPIVAKLTSYMHVAK